MPSNPGHPTAALTVLSTVASSGAGRKSNRSTQAACGGSIPVSTPGSIAVSVKVLGEAHLIRILKSYARYYNGVRTHRSLNKDAPISRSAQRDGVIRSRAILGGLDHHYSRIRGFRYTPPKAAICRAPIDFERVSGKHLSDPQGGTAFPICFACSERQDIVHGGQRHTFAELGGMPWMLHDVHC